MFSSIIALVSVVSENISLEAVNYYHKALHLGCCSSPRSASGNDHPRTFLEKLTLALHNHFLTAIRVFQLNLTLPVPCISESFIEIKIKLNFYFHISLWCIKRFYYGLLGLYIKPFEAPQRSLKIKI